MSSSQPSNVQEPNLSSHRWMSNGNHRTSTLHVLVNIPKKESEWGQVWGDKAGREKAGTPNSTWRQIFTVATGVHQHVGLEGGIKLVMSAVEEQPSDGSASTAASRAANVHHTCCRAVCQASTPGRVWSEGSLLRDTLTGSTGGSGRTIAGRRNSSIWINKCTGTRPYFSSNLDFAWHTLSESTAASSVFIRFIMRSGFCVRGMETQMPSPCWRSYYSIAETQSASEADQYHITNGYHTTHHLQPGVCGDDLVLFILAQSTYTFINNVMK